MFPNKLFGGVGGSMSEASAGFHTDSWNWAMCHTDTCLVPAAGGEWGELNIYHTQPSVHGALVYVLGNCKLD